MTVNLKSIGFAVCVLALSSQGALAEMLFKVVTVKDEIVIGLNDKELARWEATQPASPRRWRRTDR